MEKKFNIDEFLNSDDGFNLNVETEAESKKELRETVKSVGLYGLKVLGASAMTSFVMLPFASFASAVCAESKKSVKLFYALGYVMTNFVVSDYCYETFSKWLDQKLNG